MRRIIFVIISLFFAGITFAQTKSTEIETINSEKFYIHTVQAKETFYGLSKTYGVSIDDIQRSNDNLKALSIGQKIRIPVLVSAEESQYSDGQIIVKNGQSFIVHNVQQGETIYALARTYGTSAGQILIANPSINNSQISIGQQLFIPFSGTKVDAPAQNTKSQPVASTTQNEVAETYSGTKSGNTIKYTVTDEKTVAEISEKLHIPSEVIREYNPEIPDKIYQNYEITIPTNMIYFPKSYIFCSSRNTTLSELAMNHNVSTAEILHHNPYGIAHFNDGVYIQIPINEANESLAKKQINERNYLYHTVQQGETEYSISHLYHTDESTLISNNPTVDFINLAEGIILRIPYQSTFYEYIPDQKQFSKGTTSNSLAIINPNINISLLLPFFLDKNFQPQEEGIINKPKEIYEHTYQFLEYYEGALLALDSLKKFGLNITVNVIESNNDSATTHINQIKTNTNMIIGPVFPKTFPAAAGFAKRHSIPIISPLATEETNATNPFVVQMNTPQKQRFKAMVSYILENNENAHVCIVYNSETLEKKSMTLCKAAFNEQKSKLDAKHISFADVYFPSSGMSGLEQAMTKKAKTIFVVLSKQQAFANNIVTKLYQSTKTHNIELWGLPQWEVYENLELDFLFDLNFKLVTSGEIDYTSPNVNQFITTYREKYNTEPTKFSFQGFDQMLFLVKQYASSTNFLEELKNAENTVGMQSNFNFYQKDGALVNTTAFIVEYDKNTYSRKATPATNNQK